MMRSANPSPLRSPAEDTAMPLLSPAASPVILKPVLPLRLERSITAGNCGMLTPQLMPRVCPGANNPNAKTRVTSACHERAQRLGKTLRVNKLLHAEKTNVYMALSRNPSIFDRFDPDERIVSIFIAWLLRATNSTTSLAQLNGVVRSR